MADPTGYKYQLLNSDGSRAQSVTESWLYGCGYNNSGKLGNGTNINYSSPIQIGSLTNWKQVSAGWSHTIAIKTDGTLWTWGNGAFGQLGNSDTSSNYPSPIQIGITNSWKQVSAGASHSAAIDNTGKLFVFGRNQSGQLGVGNTVDYSFPINNSVSFRWNNVYCSDNATFAIKTDGTLWAWGSNYSGNLGNGSVSITYSSPIQIGLLTNWKQVSPRDRQTLSIKTDGTLWTWGQNNYGNLGNGTTTDYSSPIQIGLLTNWKQVGCGYFFSTAIKTDGTLWTWGWNNYGQLGNGTTVNYSSPIQIGSLTNWSQVFAGYDSVAAIKTDGTLWAWGANNFGGLGDGTTTSYSSPIQVGSLTDWSQVSCNLYNFLALRSRYTPNNVDLADVMVQKDQFLTAGLWAWGYGGYGAIGDGSGNWYSSPIQIGSLTNWKTISSGIYTEAVIKTDGTLWTWGDSSNGRLGNNISGAGINYYSPIQVGLLTNWKQVAVGPGVVAVKTDGSLWSWGDNYYGGLGNGTTINYSSPIQIGSLTNWKQVACGYYTSMAIKTDGTLWSWGYNNNGQLGNGTRVYYSSPIQIGSLTNWKQVACGYYTSMAIKTDGTLWSWGLGSYGILGNGTITNYSSPVQVGSLTNWKQVSTGKFFTTAIKTDGTLWSWGYNNNGQLGNGTTINYSSPIQVGSLTNWKQVSSSFHGFHTSAIKTDGTLWSWGQARFGALGNGTTIYYSSPIQIGSLTNWKVVSCGYATTHAIQSPDYIWNQ